MDALRDSIGNFLGTVRRRSPLVHNITNFVAMNSSANILLALGAAPVMAHAPDEVQPMVGLADALVLNIGTLEQGWVDSMSLAASAARRKGIPIVLDPVGAGATEYRTTTVHRLLQEGRVTVLRGNLSELLALVSSDVRTRGVDSGLAGEPTPAVIEALREAARTFECTAAASGVVDVITDGERTFLCRNGHAMMPRVTALGCGLSAVVAAFCAAAPGRVTEAVAAAVAFYGLCGEIAAGTAQGPGTFFVGFLDALYRVSPEQLAAAARIERL